MRRCRLASAVGALLITTAVNATPTAISMFGLYEENRGKNIPNYITEDFLLLNYALIRSATLSDIEQKRSLPLLKKIISKLRHATAKAMGPVEKANRDFVAVLDALITNTEAPVDAGDGKRARAELRLILDAKGIATSPLWAMRMDYSQFSPRGHYSQTKELEHYFRAYRYASAVLFAVTESRATGVSNKAADRMVQQAQQLIEVLGDDYEKFVALIRWGAGTEEDLRADDLRKLRRQFPDPTAHRRALLKFAQTHDRQPTIINGVVDASRLEPGVTARDVLTGWRLLPLFATPDAVAFQRLVFDEVKNYRDDCAICPTPFGLATIQGRKVKGFPSAQELMSLLGSHLARKNIDLSRQTAFEGYEPGVEKAQQELARGSGLPAAHLSLMRTWLTRHESESIDEERRLNSMIAFWTWQRYLNVLYSKQSYTLAGKGLSVPTPRPGAWIEPLPVLYDDLLKLVSAHRENAPHDAWDHFADVLKRAAAISRKERSVQSLNTEDEEFLNNLDRTMIDLTARVDLPIVVDVHTNPSSGEVVEEALGYPQTVTHKAGEKIAARGALFTHCEFKQRLSERLNDERWKRLLDSGQLPPGCLLNAHPKLTDRANPR